MVDQYFEPVDATEDKVEFGVGYKSHKMSIAATTTTKSSSALRSDKSDIKYDILLSSERFGRATGFFNNSIAPSSF